ncbi:conserved eukaryotic protein [Trypanosoma cruzi]|nr:conserved eukaryotic protein [Trypanosoma cruzi]
MISPFTFLVFFFVCLFVFVLDRPSHERCVLQSFLEQKMLRASRLWKNIRAADIEAKIRASDILQPLQDVKVVDASGGCGSFFNITVVSHAFRDKPLVQQHRLVNEALKGEIPLIHGFSLTTKAE